MPPEDDFHGYYAAPALANPDARIEPTPEPLQPTQEATESEATESEPEPTTAQKRRTPKKAEIKYLYICLIASFVGTYNSFLIQSIFQGDKSP
jgi:hypothetical protein